MKLVYGTFHQTPDQISSASSANCSEMQSFGSGLVAHESQNKALPEYRLSHDRVSGSRLIQNGGFERGWLLRIELANTKSSSLSILN